MSMHTKPNIIESNTIAMIKKKLTFYMLSAICNSDHKNVYVSICKKNYYTLNPSGTCMVS